MHFGETIQIPFEDKKSALMEYDKWSHTERHSAKFWMKAQFKSAMRNWCKAQGLRYINGDYVRKR